MMNYIKKILVNFLYDKDSRIEDRRIYEKE